MRLTVRDSSLSGQNYAWVVVEMSQQICHSQGKTAGNVPSCVSPFTHIHCERLSQTLIPLSHLLLLTRTKGRSDPSDKKKSEKIERQKSQLYEVVVAWDLHIVGCQMCLFLCLVLLCHDESNSLVIVKSLYNFILMHPGSNFASKLYCKRIVMSNQFMAKHQNDWRITQTKIMKSPEGWVHDWMIIKDTIRLTDYLHCTFTVTLRKGGIQQKWSCLFRLEWREPQ